MCNELVGKSPSEGSLAVIAMIVGASIASSFLASPSAPVGRA